ncbi:hypothetical protein LX77_02985, partial [Gelidibacter algens]
SALMFLGFEIPLLHGQLSFETNAQSFLIYINSGINETLSILGFLCIHPKLNGKCFLSTHNFGFKLNLNHRESQIKLKIITNIQPYVESLRGS